MTQDLETPGVTVYHREGGKNREEQQDGRVEGVTVVVTGVSRLVVT